MVDHVNLFSRLSFGVVFGDILDVYHGVNYSGGNMMQRSTAEGGTYNVNMPNFGNLGTYSVVEIFVQPGQVVAVEQPLLTVEANKTSSEVSAPVEGVVGTIMVSVGDEVYSGACVMTINT